MEYIDLRKVGREGIKQIRSQVVRLNKMGKGGKKIEELTGVRQNRVREIWATYQREDGASLEQKSYGRKPGTHMLLEIGEQAGIRKTIVVKRRKILVYLAGCGHWDERDNTSRSDTIRK